MSGRLEVKTYRCKRCSWESEPKTVFSFENPVFTCDLCGAKCSPAGDKNKNESEDIIVDDEEIVIINSDDEEVDEEWDKNVKNGFDLSDKKNPPEKRKPPQDDSKAASFQDSFASSVKTFQDRQREQAEQLRKMWNLGGSEKKPDPPKPTSLVVKVERTPYVPPPPFVPPRPNGIVVPNPVELKVIRDPPKPLILKEQNSLSDLTPEDLRITCDPPTNQDKMDAVTSQDKMDVTDEMDELDKVRQKLGLPVTRQTRQNGGIRQSPAEFRTKWKSKNNDQINVGPSGPSPRTGQSQGTGPSLSTGPSPAEFRAAWNKSEVQVVAGQQVQNVLVKTGGQHGQNVLTDYEEAMKRKEEAAKFREEWNRKNGPVGETPTPGQNALQVQSELQVQIYQCEHCGWESEPKTVFASTANSSSTCDLCGFRSVKKPPNDLSKHNYNVRMEEHNKMLLQRHTEYVSSDEFKDKMLHPEKYEQERKRKSHPKVRSVGGGSGGLDKHPNTPAGLLRSLYGNANAVNAPVATSFYVNDLLKQDNTEVVIDVDEQDENIEEGEKEPEEEKTEEPPADNLMKRPPKNWESAEVAGFPQGWLWKRTNAWSRRIKLMSSHGKVFNWRNAAVAHMEEQYPYVYTRMQIDRAKNWEDKDWRDKHDKQEVECS